MDIQELFKEAQDNYNKIYTDEGFNGVRVVDGFIELDGFYDIDLSRVKTKEALLSWIAQLAGKNWVTVHHIYWLIDIASAHNGFNPHMNV